MQIDVMKNEIMLSGFDLPNGIEFEYPVGLIETAADGVGMRVVMDSVRVANKIREIAKGNHAEILDRWPGIVTTLSDMTADQVELHLDGVCRAMKLPKKLARGEMLSAIADRNAAWAEIESLARDDDQDVAGDGVEDALEREANEKIHKLKRSQEIFASVESIAVDPLGAFDKALDSLGVVGERRVATTVYLAAMSAHLDRPFSVVVKAQSSTGKSFTTEKALLLSGTAYVKDVASLTPRSIIYDDEAAYQHRTIYLEEGEILSVQSGEVNPAAEMMRNLMSKGYLRHATVERDPDTGKNRTFWLTQEGPTNLITTTTRPTLHPEVETRMLSLYADESEDQTRAIMRESARRAAGYDAEEVDIEKWALFTEYVRLGPRKVVLPFGPALAELLPAVTVRMRRDEESLFALAKASALVHRAERDLDSQGRIVADMEDYQVARNCIGDAVAVEHGLKLTENASDFLSMLRDRLIKPMCEALEHPDGTSGKTCWDYASGCPHNLPMPPSSSTIPHVGYEQDGQGIYSPVIQATGRDLAKTLGLSKSTLNRRMSHVAKAELIEYEDDHHLRRGKGRAFRIVADVWDVLKASQNPSAGLPSVAEVISKMKIMTEAAEIF